MRITSVETISFKPEAANSNGRPVWTWVFLHTDEGVSGLGETYSTTFAEATAIQDLSGYLLGKDPRTIERHWSDLYQMIQYVTSGGAEIRALSALDGALWDLFGKWTGKPLYQLMGGKTRCSAPIYNTCYDSRYDFNKESRLLAEDLA
jgi:galactonate dehydratase